MIQKSVLLDPGSPTLLMLISDQVSVVHRLGSANKRINHYPVEINVFRTNSGAATFGMHYRARGLITS